MQLVDYTHPLLVPALYLAHDRRSIDYYRRLDNLEKDHAYFYTDWALFRHRDWLEGGSAWVQAKSIVEDVERYAESKGISLDTIRLVIGSGDHAFDEGLAQALISFGYTPLVAEVGLAKGVADIPLNESIEEEEEEVLNHV